MSNIKETRINNLVVKGAPKWGGNDTRPPRGEKLFDNPFSNVYLSAKKHSGKTSNLFFILRRILGPKTKLIIYCSTVHSDASWVFMVKYFKVKGIEMEIHTSLKENGVDLLALKVKQLELENEAKLAEEEGEEEEIPPEQIVKQKGTGAMNAILMHNLPPEITGEGKKKEKKSKYNERKIVFVLDDLSTELRSKSLVGLLKVSRHFGTVFLSSQYYLDIEPSSRLQIDYALVYKGATEDKMEAMYKDFDLDIDYEQFEKLYELATKEPFSFLYINVRKSEFRKNYNTKLNLE
jgi:hypothetical protein